MVRKLSLGSRRRSSKASREGSLRENMAKADIRASARGISTSAERGSAKHLKRERTSRRRESAERCLRAFLAERLMVRDSVQLNGKMGDLGRYCDSDVYEKEEQDCL